MFFFKTVMTTRFTRRGPGGRQILKERQRGTLGHMARSVVNEYEDVASTMATRIQTKANSGGSGILSFCLVCSDLSNGSLSRPSSRKPSCRKRTVLLPPKHTQVAVWTQTLYERRLHMQKKKERKRRAPCELETISWGSGESVALGRQPWFMSAPLFLGVAVVPSSFYFFLLSRTLQYFQLRNHSIKHHEGKSTRLPRL